MPSRSRLSILALILLAWAPWLVPAAYSAVWQWSETASSNASADPAINWREGQPPSSVNDSARAMMAALAAYRDDISGLLTTGGTATAYTVATNQGLCAAPSTVPQDGQQLSITMSATNGVSPTLTADSCNAYPIQSSAGVAVGAASLIQGSPYTMRFSVSNSAWMLRNFYGTALIVPLGGMIPYTGTTVPNSNFVFPAGQCLSTTTYASYWTFLGSPASGSCAGGQFAIVDLRGRVPAMLDGLAAQFSAANRLTSAGTGCGTVMQSVGAVCANGVEGFALTLAQLPTGITSSGSNSVTVTSNLNLAGTSGNVSVSGGATGVAAESPASSNNTWTNVNSMSGSVSISSTSNNTSGAAHPNVPPTIGVTYLLRVL